MQFKDIATWNKRVSLVYAVGVWTMIGTYGYYVYTGAYDDKPEKVTGKVNRKEEDEEEKPSREVIYQTPHTKTTVIYKENFVPYTTRIMNFINSFSEDSKK